MKKCLFNFLRFAGNETKRILRFLFRHTFSWYGGLFGFLLLVVILGWLLVYVPTIGEAKRIDAITAEFKAHGCRSIHSEAVPMFETHWLLKHFKLEKKELQRLVFGPGSIVPKPFLEDPPYLPDLYMITFENSESTDEEFTWALKNPSLRILHLSGDHHVSLRGFLSLADRKNDINLVLSSNDSIDRDILELVACQPSCLKALSLDNCEFDDACLENLARLDSLTWLSLDGCWGYSTQGLEPLKNLPNLLFVHGLPPDKQAEFDELIRLRIESTP